ncbi:hypothetical protein AAMO2058_000550100 [Amorphochlora amoebiformis]
MRGRSRVAVPLALGLAALSLTCTAPPSRLERAKFVGGGGKSGSKAMKRMAKEYKEASREIGASLGTWLTYAGEFVRGVESFSKLIAKREKLQKHIKNAGVSEPSLDEAKAFLLQRLFPSAKNTSNRPSEPMASVLASEPMESEPKGSEPKTSGPKMPEPRESEPKVPGLKASEPKVQASKASKRKIAEPKTSEPKSSELKMSEIRSLEPRAPEVKPKSSEAINLEERVVYQIQGVKAGQETGRWYDLASCVQNSDGTFKVKVADTQDAIWARMAGKKASRVRENLIRLKPPEDSEESGMIEENADEEPTDPIERESRRLDHLKHALKYKSDETVFQMQIYELKRPKYWVDCRLQIAEDGDNFECTVKDTLYASFAGAYVNVTLSPIPPKDVRIRPDNYRTEYPPEYLKFETVSMSANKKRDTESNLDPGQRSFFDNPTIAQKIRENLPNPTSQPKPDDERLKALEKLGLAPQAAEYIKYQVVGVKDGKPSGRWYDLDNCTKQEDGTYTIKVAHTPVTNKLRLAGKVHQKVKPEFIRMKTSTIEKFMKRANKIFPHLSSSIDSSDLEQANMKKAAADDSSEPDSGEKGEVDEEKLLRGSTDSKASCDSSDFFNPMEQAPTYSPTLPPSVVKTPKSALRQLDKGTEVSMIGLRNKHQFNNQNGTIHGPPDGARYPVKVGIYLLYVKPQNLVYRGTNSSLGYAEDPDPKPDEIPRVQATLTDYDPLKDSGETTQETLSASLELDDMPYGVHREIDVLKRNKDFGEIPSVLRNETWEEGREMLQNGALESIKKGYKPIPIKEFMGRTKRKDSDDSDLFEGEEKMFRDALKQEKEKNPRTFEMKKDWSHRRGGSKKNFRSRRRFVNTRPKPPASTA